MNEPEYARMAVTITSDNKVYIGEEKVPGCIAKDGISIYPGGAQDITRMTVEFLVVGPINIEGKE
jgi:hypothetical protein